MRELSLLLQALSGQVIHKSDLIKLQRLLQRKSVYFRNMDKTILSAMETIYFNIDWVLRNVGPMQKQLDRRNSITAKSKNNST